MKLQRKIGCFSDIHLGLYQDNIEWHEIAIKFAKWAAQKYKEKEIEDIIIPGDIFHNRSYISVETLAASKQFFEIFKDFNIYVSTGNHDCFKKDNSDVNSISIFNNWHNIHVVDEKPILLETVNSKKISLVPWGATLNQVPKSDIMFGHFEISSFYMNSYKLCEHGISYKDLFTKASMILSGHFHKRDHRTYDKGQIVYLGSPYQQNFGDSKDDRGIYILDTDNNTFQFIENDISPKYLKITFGETLKEEVVQNNFISLVVDNNQDEENIIKYKAQIFELKPRNIKLQYNEDESKENSFDENQKFENCDLITTIEEYVKTLDDENKDEIFQRIKDLYEKLN
jgi:DNA repair exonuclease SbcCD nuclease subunit